MHEAIPPLPHMSSWHGAWLSTGTTLPLLLGDQEQAGDTQWGGHRYKVYVGRVDKLFVTGQPTMVKMVMNNT
jgi:hypothetical protein